MTVFMSKYAPNKNKHICIQKHERDNSHFTIMMPQIILPLAVIMLSTPHSIALFRDIFFA